MERPLNGSSLVEEAVSELVSDTTFEVNHLHWSSCVCLLQWSAEKTLREQNTKTINHLI